MDPNERLWEELKAKALVLTTSGSFPWLTAPWSVLKSTLADLWPLELENSGLWYGHSHDNIRLLGLVLGLDSMTRQFPGRKLRVDLCDALKREAATLTLILWMAKEDAAQLYELIPDEAVLDKLLEGVWGFKQALKPRSINRVRMSFPSRFHYYWKQRNDVTNHFERCRHHLEWLGRTPEEARELISTLRPGSLCTLSPDMLDVLSQHYGTWAALRGNGAGQSNMSAEVEKHLNRKWPGRASDVDDVTSYAIGLLNTSYTQLGVYGFESSVKTWIIAVAGNQLKRGRKDLGRGDPPQLQHWMLEVQGADIDARRKLEVLFDKVVRSRCKGRSRRISEILFPRMGDGSIWRDPSQEYPRVRAADLAQELLTNGRQAKASEADVISNITKRLDAKMYVAWFFAFEHPLNDTIERKVVAARACRKFGSWVLTEKSLYSIAVDARQKRKQGAL